MKKCIVCGNDLEGVLINNNGDILNPEDYSTSMQGVWSCYYCPVCGLKQSGLGMNSEEIEMLKQEYKKFLTRQLGKKVEQIKQAIKECQKKGLNTVFFD